jgi:hypothetical protein
MDGDARLLVAQDRETIIQKSLFYLCSNWPTSIDQIALEMLEFDRPLFGLPIRVHQTHPQRRST